MLFRDLTEMRRRPLAFILCGLPGSGKTTVAYASCRRLKLGTATNPYKFEDAFDLHLSLDDLREPLTAGAGARWSREMEGRVRLIAEDFVELWLRENARVLIEATNLTRDKRRYWVSLARALGATTAIGYISISAYESVCRVSRRREGALVPEEAIRKMAETYERPTADEADLVVCIRMNPLWRPHNGEVPYWVRKEASNGSPTD